MQRDSLLAQAYLWHRQNGYSAKAALALLREMKEARKAGMAPGGAICAALRGKVESLLETIQEARKKRDELCRGWLASWRNDALHNSFLEGAAQ